MLTNREIHAFSIQIIIIITFPQHFNSVRSKVKISITILLQSTTKSHFNQLFSDHVFNIITTGLSIISNETFLNQHNRNIIM